MPVVPTYPGVYIEEVPSNVHTIIGVATSITAFIGRTLRGPLDTPVRIQSFADYERRFGGLWVKSSVGHAVQQYFQNGGADAIIVRVAKGAGFARISVPAGNTGSLELEADSPGEWGNQLRVGVDHLTADSSNPNLFNLYIQEYDSATSAVLAAETFRNLSLVSASPRFVTTVLEQESRLVNVNRAFPLPASRPNSMADVDGKLQYISANGGSGSHGNPVSATEILGTESGHTGLYALDKADLFNLLCIPPYDPEDEEGVEADDSDIKGVYSAALQYCIKRRAMLLIDPLLKWNTVEAMEAAALKSQFEQSPNAITYWPRLRMPDPLKENRLSTFAPCGVMAGLIARIDAQRGVWKAPAGIEATLVGVQDLTYTMTNGENGRLNPLGINCLRAFPIMGRVAWGSRTTRGADQFGSEWKYIPVRRLALYIEESLYRGTQWAVFEPNDEPLWAQIRLNLGGFMQDLFRKGAFQGSSPRQAYLVKCDHETTTQGDIDRGIVNIIVGFAPLKPAEFVIIKLTQLAGQEQG